MAHAAAAAVPLRRPLLLLFFRSARLLSSLAPPSPSSRRARPPRGALRPVAPLPSEPGGEDPGDAADFGRSRNEKKREARRAVQWGMELAKFSTPQIKRIVRAASLEIEVLEALMLVKKFGPDVREGRRRKYNYICMCMFIFKLQAFLGMERLGSQYCSNFRMNQSAAVHV